MTLVVDAGALVALERNYRSMWRRLRAELDAGTVPVTHAGVVGQVWRGARGRQASLARALAGIEIVALDDDSIVTSDPAGIQRLVDAAARRVDVVPA